MMSHTKFEIVSDPKTMTITVGDKVFDEPDLFRRPEGDFHFKNQICSTPINICDLDPKTINRLFAEILGPKFNRRFFAANYWLWIGNRMTTRTANMLRYHGYHWRDYNASLVKRANAALPYVNEAERDGLYHLIPAILYYKTSPQQIRAEIGRGAWRRVASNSVSRNLLILHAVLRCREVDRKDAFVRLLDIPSGILPAIEYGANENEVIAARITPRKRPLEFKHTVDIVKDTRQLTLDRFNAKWSLARLQHEHDLATKAIMRNKYSTENFADSWKFAEDGFLAELLTSQEEIATEGAIQHHCVARYAQNAANGQCLIFKISGEERATASIENGVVEQVYGAYNSQVSNRCRRFVYKVANHYVASSMNVAA